MSSFPKLCRYPSVGFLFYFHRSLLFFDAFFSNMQLGHFLSAVEQALETFTIAPMLQDTADGTFGLRSEKLAIVEGPEEMSVVIHARDSPGRRACTMRLEILLGTIPGRAYSEALLLGISSQRDKNGRLRDPLETAKGISAGADTTRTHVCCEDSEMFSIFD